MKGIDVSEHNGSVDYEVIKQAGYDFVIVRLGYGKSTLDSKFYENVNGALNAGLKIGVYHYSYALDIGSAEIEAEFVTAILEDCGLSNDKLEMGVWFDMEDGDGYKARHGVTNSAVLTDICLAFMNTVYERGYSVGLYANLDYLENILYMNELQDFPVWVAQYNSTCDYTHAVMWQYTDSEKIGNNYFDGNITVY